MKLKLSDWSSCCLMIRAVIYNAYRDGSLDFIDSVPTDEVKTLLETQDPEFKVVIS